MLSNRFFVFSSMIVFMHCCSCLSPYAGVCNLEMKPYLTHALGHNRQLHYTQLFLLEIKYSQLYMQHMQKDLLSVFSLE